MSTHQSPIISDIDFERDGKQLSFLRVPNSRNNSAWGTLLVPITVIKHGDGPTVLFIGGSHGDEYEGPVCLGKLSRELPADAMQGRIILLPALNLPAAQAGQRLSPIDGKDMNRVFPGDPRGTISQVIAHYVQTGILPLCDAVVDLHSGGYSLKFVPYMSMHYLDDQAQTERTLAALKAFRAPVGLVIREISGEGLVDYEVERMGKVFLCAELGGAGRLSVDSLRIAEVGTRNLLKHFGLIDGDLESVDGVSESRLMEVPGPDYYCMARTNGVYESFRPLGDAVEAGQPVGQIHFVGEPARSPEPIVAQQAGQLIGTRGPGHVERGDTVAVIACDLAER